MRFWFRLCDRQMLLSVEGLCCPSFLFIGLDVAGGFYAYVLYSQLASEPLIQCDLSVSSNALTYIYIVALALWGSLFCVNMFLFFGAILNNWFEYNKTISFVMYARIALTLAMTCEAATMFVFLYEFGFLNCLQNQTDPTLYTNTQKLLWLCTSHSLASFLFMFCGQGSDGGASATLRSILSCCFCCCVSSQHGSQHKEQLLGSIAG
jgi:hypothetical protein